MLPAQLALWEADPCALLKEGDILRSIRNIDFEACEIRDYATAAGSALDLGSGFNKSPSSVRAAKARAPL